MLKWPRIYNLRGRTDSRDIHLTRNRGWLPATLRLTALGNKFITNRWPLPEVNLFHRTAHGNRSNGFSSSFSVTNCAACVQHSWVLRGRCCSLHPIRLAFPNVVLCLLPVLRCSTLLAASLLIQFIGTFGDLRAHIDRVLGHDV